MAAEPSVTVTDVTVCNPISVADRAVMLNIDLVRNYITSYQTSVDGGWSIADRVQRAYDVEGMVIGIVAYGCIRFAGLHCPYPLRPGTELTFDANLRRPPVLRPYADGVAVGRG